MTIRTICRATVLVITLAAGCTPAADIELSTKIKKAQDVFAEATTADEFLRSASLFQEVLDTGFVSGAILYNQGNAFMRAGQRGRAVACYRQAQRYLPRDPYLQANLRSALGSGTSATESRPFIENILFWQNWISYPTKFRVTAIFAFVCFAASVSATLVARKRALAYLTWATLAFALLFLLSSWYDWHRFHHIRHGVVISGEVVARKGNAESYEPAFTKPLVETTEFRVVEIRNEWVLARMAEGQEAWIPRDDTVIY